VLSPDELDIEASESVVSLDDDRYVIGAGDELSVPDGVTELPGDDGSGTDANAGSAPEPLSDATAGPAAEGPPVGPQTPTNRPSTPGELR
jgi:hypothetical protein